MKTKTLFQQNDQNTSVDFLKNIMGDFIKERKWEKFHTPRNLAISICLESSELLEHFQWVSPDEKHQTSMHLEEIGDEMADVLAYLLSLSNVLKIDLTTAFQKKMAKNSLKYPADQFQGKWEKK